MGFFQRRQYRIISFIFQPALQKGGIVGENTKSDCKELVVFYYLPTNDRREFVGKWEPYVPYTISLFPPSKPSYN